MKKMTPWESGDCLIHAADDLLDHEKDLREGGYYKFAKMLREMRLTIGDHVNAMRDLNLPGMPDHKNTKRRRR